MRSQYLLYSLGVGNSQGGDGTISSPQHHTATGAVPANQSELSITNLLASISQSAASISQSPCGLHTSQLCRHSVVGNLDPVSPSEHPDNVGIRNNGQQ